jgi:hypothetical protein
MKVVHLDRLAPYAGNNDQDLLFGANNLLEGGSDTNSDNVGSEEIK